jgi:hypothetical protein
MTKPRISTGSFFSRYRAAILFNKNLVISGAAGFFASALVSQFYSQYDKGEFANSLVALATEYVVYLPIFGILFYLDNRQRYYDTKTGKINRRLVSDDIRKVLASFSVSEAIYSITRVSSQYGLLEAQVAEPYQVSMISSLSAWAIFFISINVMAKLTNLLKKPSQGNN